MEAEYTTEITVTGTQEELKKLIALLKKYQNGELNTELYDVQLNNKKLLILKDDHSISKLLDASNGVINIDALGPGEGYSESVSETRLFERIAEEIPNAFYQGKICGFATYYNESIESEFRDGILRLEEYYESYEDHEEDQGTRIERYYDPVKKEYLQGSEEYDVLSEPVYKDTNKPSSINDWEYKETKSGRIELTLYKGIDTEVIVPNCVGDKPVESIGDWAFIASAFPWKDISDGIRRQHRNIARIILPNGLKNIGKEAFAFCESLEKIEIPDSVKKIGDGAFASCKNLKRVVIPDKTKLGKGVFEDCVSMSDDNGFIIFRDTMYGYTGKDTVLEIPEGIKEIYCHSLGLTWNDEKRVHEPAVTYVKLPDSLEYISDDAFRDLESLKTVIMPSHKVEIGENAFYGCVGLADDNGCIVVQNMLFDYQGNNKEAVLPEGLEIICSRAFWDNPVTAIHIPGSVNTIAKDAFFRDALRKKLKTVFGKPGSAAEEFAKNNRKKFIEE